MPVKDLDDFKSQYYSIISKILQKMVKSQDHTVDKKYVEELQELKGLAQGKEIDVSGFRFAFGLDLDLDRDASSVDKISEVILNFFSNIDSGEPYGGGVSGLDIPDINKQEIQAQGFVNAFDKMKEKGSDPAEFQRYYENVRKLSLPLDLHEVKNPELKESLEKSNGIFDNFNRVYNKTYGKSSDVFGDTREIEAPDKEHIIDMLGKAEKAYELQQELRLELAKHIAINKIPVFDEKGQVSEKIDDLEVGNIFKDKALGGGVSGYLNKHFNDLIKEQSEKVKLNKVFNALGIDGLNTGNFKKLIAQEKDKIDREKVVKKPTVKLDTVNTDIKSQAKPKLGNVPGGGELPTKPTLSSVKEQMARNILAVAKVHPAVIDKIMNNPEMAKAKEAIMKRADNALTNLGVDTKSEFGLTTKLASIKDEALQNQVEAQSKGLIAQVGRVSSWSIDGQDMRGKENLHEKYQDKASKLDKGTFDKNVVEALEYENSKDDKGKLETLAYNTFFRKPLQLLDAMIPVDDKPFFTPGKTALVGVMVMAFPPIGTILGIALLCKAAKDTEIGTKVVNWVSEKLLGKPEPESIIDKGALEKVSIKSLLPEKDKGKEVVHEKDTSLDEIVTKDKGTSIDHREKVEVVDIQKPKDKLQERINQDPGLKAEMDAIINKTKEIAGKDKDGKQRPMDDLDLMSAKSRLEADNRKKHSREI